MRTIVEYDLPSCDGGYVDLGLPSGIKWASCNLGAISPCGHGKLFQFGRTNGYYFNDGKHHFSRGITTWSSSGKCYKDGEILSLEDDAVYKAMGEGYRMPTKEDFDELLANTTNEWCICKTLRYGDGCTSVNGRLFTSKTDETKKIFIPTSGFYDGEYGSFDCEERDGLVWSSSAKENEIKKDWIVDTAWFLSFREDMYRMEADFRTLGCSIRGVKVD